MAKMFRVTYDIVTEESASYGDFAENGFVDNLEIRYPIETVKKNDNFNMCLRDAARMIFPDYFNGRYFEECPRQNVKTGESITFALHIPKNTTESSIKRLCKVFNI